MLRSGSWTRSPPLRYELERSFGTPVFRLQRSLARRQSYPGPGSQHEQNALKPVLVEKHGFHSESSLRDQSYKPAFQQKKKWLKYDGLAQEAGLVTCSASPLYF